VKRRIVVKHMSAFEACGAGPGDGSDMPLPRNYWYWNMFLGWRPLAYLSEDLRSGC
jgi:hypothetical protein